MDSYLIKMFLSVVCLAFVAHFIQGASQCLRTNTNPLRDCTDECLLQTGCRNARKKCLCDKDCGYSCIYPRMRCSKPRTRVRNGKIVFKSYLFNDTQRVVCKPGFRLSGSAVRTCRGNGYWDGKQARCRRPQTNCKDPGKQGLLLRLTEPKKSFKPGTKLNYYCPTKFNLRGSKILVCRRDGTWSASLPQCIAPKCNPAVLPAHTRVIRPKNWRNRLDYGTRFTLSCDYGYTSIKRGTLVCDVPAWRLEPSSFKCFPKSCPHPGTPRHGNIKGLFRFGEKVYYTCDKCYKLKGPSYRQCQADQRWTDSQPTCEPATCSFLRNPANGYLTSNSQKCDSIVQYHCDHGYQLRGFQRRRCQSDETWTGNEPICEIGIKPSPTLKTQAASKASKMPATIVTQFLTTTIPLNSSCGQPHLPRTTRKLFYKRNKLYLGCKQNYKTLRTGMMLCNQTQHKWQRVRNSSCLRKSCSNPGIPRRGYKHGLSYFIDDVVTFTCEPCYRLEGNSQRTCLKNESWSYSQPKCVLKTCPPPKNSTEATVSHISLSCGAIATYKCKDSRLTMLGSGEKICNQSGMWQGAEPKCIDPNLNIAFGRPVSMSSFWKKFSSPAHYLVNGNRLSGFIHTNYEYGPWVKIDLVKKEPVSTVIVVNRRNCCVQRINGFKVSVGNKANEAGLNKLCGGRTKAIGGEMIIQCSQPLRGRYVFVYLPKEKNRLKTMALFEVEVYRKRHI